MRKRMVGAISVAVLAVAGCGDSEDYANDARPPAPINIAITVTDDRVTIGRTRVGAGPAKLIVSNQSDVSRDVLLSPPEGSNSACLDADASSGPINPMGTATLSVDLVEGDCSVSVRGKRSLEPALLVVDGERPSAQADLLQP